MIPELGKHAVPVLGAYGLTLLLLALLVVLTWKQAKSAKIRLGQAETLARKMEGEDG